jgi:hypothetical protein
MKLHDEEPSKILSIIIIIIIIIIIVLISRPVRRVAHAEWSSRVKIKVSKVKQ